MKRLLLVGLTIFVASLRAQDPPPAPAVEPQPQQPPPSSQPSAQELQEQRLREQAQRAAEEAARKRLVDSLRPPDPDTRLLTPPETCLSQAGPADRKFDLESIPLTGWLALGQKTDTPWRVQVGRPMLRMDQRYEISFSARLAAKDLKHLQVGDELLFVSGINSRDGKWLTTPKVRRQTLTREFPSDSFINYAECLFVRPGDYVLWLAFYDARTRNHNVITRRIRVAETRNNPLPRLSANLPDAEFPEASPANSKILTTGPGRLFLPAQNATRLIVDVISIVSPPEQWSDRPDILESHANKVLAAVGVLSQIALAKGSVSATAIDLVNRATPFDQKNVESLDWRTLALAFSHVADSAVVSRSALETAKDRGAFFRESLQQRLNNSGEMRIAIVVSSSMVFEKGSDLRQRPAGCNCRLYHLRFRHNRADLYDDLEKIMKPLRPRTLDVASSLEFRQALAEIIQDLERL